MLIKMPLFVSKVNKESEGVFKEVILNKLVSEVIIIQGE